MSVGGILRDKGREVFTLSSRATLQVVIDVLATRHVGSLVITDTFGSMIGIISERDVVRAIAARGSRALDDFVADYMTTDVTIAREDDDIDALLSKMSEGRFRHVPIFDGDRLAGIVSQGDAIKFRLGEMKVEHAAIREYILA